jgi:hypothetical protein
MISRFFKKTAKKAPEPKKKAKAAPEPSFSSASQRAKPTPHKKLLTAEGWKRMMMRKSSKGKK